MTDHPLTETAAVEMWDASPCPEGYEFRGMLTVEQDATLYAMRSAFDAGREHERTTNPADNRPWEPLKKGDPLNVGDEVRQDHGGITATAVVGSVDGGGNPWSANDSFIGWLEAGTWYVRRAVQELPTEPGTVIIPAEGHEYVEAAFIGDTYYAREAMLADDLWRAVWRTADGVRVRYSVLPEDITPDTWKVEEK